MLAYLDTLIGFAIVMLGASLLITIATQMISTLFSHRGANLKWGLTTLFQHVPNCPLINVAERADKIATDILTHPLISDSIFSIKLPIPLPQWLVNRFKLATAIDPGELVAILKDLATKPAYKAIEGLPEELNALVAAQNPAAERRLALLTGAPALSQLKIEDAVPLLRDTLNEMKDESGKLEAWFNATMGRVSARFTMYVRLWTVGCAVALAFYTGLNSVTLLDTLYSNGAFRQQVVGAGSQMMDLANKVIPSGPTDVATKMFTGLVAKALQDSGATADATPAGIDSEAAARAWIAAHVSDPSQQAKAASAFDTAFLNERAQDAVAVRNMLTGSSFDITQFRWNPQKPFWPQFPGVLVTAGLLSLGAPFWFNMLKELTNLRPVLASKEGPGAGNG